MLAVTMQKKSTPQALKLKEALESLGIKMLSEHWDGHKHIDLSIPDAKINIEIDGPRHLTDPFQILADMNRSHGSEMLGYHTLHIHNEEIDTNLERIAVAIAEAAKIQVARRKGKSGFVDLNEK